MKTMSYVTVFILTFLLSANLANATGVRSAFNEYEISLVQDLHMGKQVKAVWKLSYSKNETPVTVVKRKTGEGTEYLVQSEYFAVCYRSTAAGFGAKEAKGAWCAVPKKINRAVINQEQLARQEILTPEKVNDEYALGLIASYLPQLINDGYTHILN
ncbi:hypothetical protein [Maribellus sp. YY47]|uniref:hypothetical protein n=1 Tax=Maribellus sp. YY47 TaxID=2929486 RepID=UPI0020006F23|nr:hypothetical protein [Maribellus sp. YY47]MCK3685196.1 hypothetical protein [Maribellus sp. YY47]